MNLKEYIKSLVRQQLEEESTSAGVPGYMTPYAFSKGKGKNAATKYAEKEGWTVTKGETTMPGDSKLYTYKNLTGKKKKKVKIYKNMNENSNKTFKYSDKVFKVGDKVKYNEVEWTIDDIISTENMTFFMMSAPGMNNRKFDAVRVANNNVNVSLANIIKEELLNEVTYHKFKNEVKFRTKSEILHKAIREVKRKLSEIDRIVEYTSRIKQELSEGEEGLRYWKKTESNIATISEMVNQLNNKIKNLH